ncbi:MAG TPA: peptide MFS transporter [Candidatus Paceibacterota bacterium]|nr:peptide MFS transporter [Candidatus Paceibacterota bacterium]
MNPATAASGPARTGHPPGLSTLFFTEMWERCSFYGMRAVLILFMTAAVQTGGLGMSDALAGAVYGLYTASVYFAALPGGWVADRLLGAQRAVWYGGLLIVLGQFTLALPRTDTFYLGLLFVVLGTGLLKPNVSAIVGQLYPEGGARRDAGFTIFYMGINLGAAIGPLVCGYLGEKVNWRLGFAAAGFGMLLGLIQFRLLRARLGEAGAVLVQSGPRRHRDMAVLGGGLGILGLVVVLIWSGLVSIDALKVAQATKWFILGLAVLFFAGVLLFGGLSGVEKKRVCVIAILFVCSALFWCGFEQAGSSFNLFAKRHTDRQCLGWVMPAGWFQMVGPVFVISLAPVVAALWVGLARRGREPSLPAKFAFGLALLGVGFLVMAWGAARAGAGLVWPTWLISTYFIHTLAELCVSPVGLSSVTKLAPPRLTGQMMGVWFLATSLGNLVAGLIAGEVSDESTRLMATRFLQIAALTGGLAVVLALLSRPVRRLMGGVR